MENSKCFDHTILKPDATKAEVIQVCNEAKEYQFASVCVNQYHTGLVAEQLKDSGVKVCTVIGFPLGAVVTSVKVFETSEAVKDGADEIDMVINIGALKDKEYDIVREDIRSVKQACRSAILKVIIETCLLTNEEKEQACRLSVEAGADFVKTSTGFSKGGATTDDVALMRRTVGDAAMVKASGGIRDSVTAKDMIQAGADRLGTSATIAIVNEM